MTNSGRADWVEGYLKIALTDFQRDCVDLICDAQTCGPYDFKSTFNSANWEHGNGVRFTISPMGLATFDFNGLTRLVVGAHDKCIRVEIRPCNMQRLEVTMFKREGREGSISRRHPTMEGAIELSRIPYES